MSLTAPDPTAAVARLASLVSELLEAQCDTVSLADDVSGDLEWTVHVAYLQGLHRVGQATLAELSDAGAL